MKVTLVTEIVTSDTTLKVTITMGLLNKLISFAVPGAGVILVIWWANKNFEIKITKKKVESSEEKLNMAPHGRSDTNEELAATSTKKLTQEEERVVDAATKMYPKPNMDPHGRSYTNEELAETSTKKLIQEEEKVVDATTKMYLKPNMDPHGKSKEKLISKIEVPLHIREKMRERTTQPSQVRATAGLKQVVLNNFDPNTFRIWEKSLKGDLVAIFNRVFNGNRVADRDIESAMRLPSRRSIPPILIRLVSPHLRNTILDSNHILMQYNIWAEPDRREFYART
jgi:hypothetical protein